MVADHQRKEEYNKKQKRRVQHWLDTQDRQINYLETME